MDLMFDKIKLKLELADPQVQGSKIQGTLRFWVRQLTCVINRTACRSLSWLVRRPWLTLALLGSVKSDWQQRAHSIAAAGRISIIVVIVIVATTTTTTTTNFTDTDTWTYLWLVKDVCNFKTH